jgi:pyruvate kinase
MSYKKLPVDVKPGHVILCADGTISLTVLSCDPEAGTVRCMCENTAMLGERKNCNLPGIVVDLPTLTEKDKEDIMEWGVPNDIDMIALSFVRKGSDLVTVRKLLGQYAKRIKLMSKVCILLLSSILWFLLVFFFPFHSLIKYLTIHR